MYATLSREKKYIYIEREREKVKIVVEMWEIKQPPLDVAEHPGSVRKQIMIVVMLKLFEQLPRWSNAQWYTKYIYMCNGMFLSGQHFW